MDFMKALTYPFDDDEWLSKLGLGVLIGLIPIVGQMTQQGWSLEIAKRIKANDPTPLPDWSDFGKYLTRGLMVLLANLIYFSPVLLFYCILFVVWFVILGGASASGSDDAMAGAAGAMPLIMGCCGCLAVIYGGVAGVVFWGGVIRYLDTEEFGIFFQFGDNFALVRENIGDFGMALVYFLLAGVAGSVVSSVTFGIGAFLLPAFMSYFGGHIIGQLAQKLSGSAAPAV